MNLDTMAVLTEIHNELKICHEESLTGEINFRFNFQQGGIGAFHVDKKAQKNISKNLKKSLTFDKT